MQPVWPRRAEALLPAALSFFFKEGGAIINVTEVKEDGNVLFGTDHQHHHHHQQKSLANLRD